MLEISHNYSMCNNCEDIIQKENANASNHPLTTRWYEVTNHFQKLEESGCRMQLGAISEEKYKMNILIQGGRRMQLGAIFQ